MDIIIRLATELEKTSNFSSNTSDDIFLVELCGDQNQQYASSPFAKFEIEGGNLSHTATVQAHHKRRIYLKKFSFKRSPLAIWQEGIQCALDTAKRYYLDKVIVLLDWNFFGKMPALFSDTNIVLDKDTHAKIILWGQYGVIQPMLSCTVLEELSKKEPPYNQMIATVDKDSDYEAKLLREHIDLSKGNSKRENIVNDSTIHFTADKYGGELLTNDKHFLKRAGSLSESNEQIKNVTIPDDYFARYEFTTEELEKVLEELEPNSRRNSNWMYISKN